MAHKFDRTKTDPYVAAARQVERNAFSSRSGLAAGAGEEIYDRIADAIVTAIGDIGAEAFRSGLNQTVQLRGLAKAIAGCAETVLMSYQGEVDPEPAIAAIEDDPRFNTLPAIEKDKLTREVAKTRQLEGLLLTARRLPALMDFAGSLGLSVHEEAIEGGTLLVPGGELPSPEAG